MSLSWEIMVEVEQMFLKGSISDFCLATWCRGVSLG